MQRKSIEIRELIIQSPVAGADSRKKGDRFGGQALWQEDTMNKKMKWTVMLVLVLSLALSGMLASVAAAQQSQRQRTPSRQVTTSRVTFQKGYVNGYKDGNGAGKKDYQAKINTDFRNYDQYSQADRGYLSSYGRMNDYQDGYRLGFEMGYVDGYYGRTYSTKLPTNATALRVNPSYVGETQLRAGYLVPNNTELVLRLNDTLNTKSSQRGDKFQATVVSPTQYEGATVLGHIADIQRSGRMTGRTEMLLEFDTITLRNGRSAVFHATLIKVHESETVKSVDQEGNIETAAKGRETAIRAGGAAAVGAIIGAIAGGGKGAAIGALIGAGVGAGSVYIQGNKDLILESQTEMTVRASAPEA